MEKYILKVREDGSEITLRDVQMKTLEILLEFDRICKKHNLEYALGYGTALGAVRHKGFIPWDDDVDVMMTYDTYHKLLEILPDEIQEPYYYHCLEKDDAYNVLIPEMKFRMGGTYVKEQNSLLMNKCEGDGLFIDVFAVDKVSESKFKYLSSLCFSIACMPMFVFLDNIGIQAAPLKRWFNNRAKRYAAKHKDSKYTALNLTWTFFPKLEDQRVPNEVMWPTIDMEFEGHMLPMPPGYHEYLVSLFGESYMQFPPEKQQKPKHIDDIEI
ncbi:LicD family protein [Erysipelothrix sp. HDW6B]|uniref:LicD family protein n=1 Tax=Erysipelothrix TaxID=1647 RepID=UPI00135B5383|nr:MULTISPECIES: LicD family protein [Erysipelothrix]QIK86448.1 LicD family protein [Erysipelothrix sp. HDW6B]